MWWVDNRSDVVLSINRVMVLFEEVSWQIFFNTLRYTHTPIFLFVDPRSFMKVMDPLVICYENTPFVFARGSITIADRPLSKYLHDS